MFKGHVDLVKSQSEQVNVQFNSNQFAGQLNAALAGGWCILNRFWVVFFWTEDNTNLEQHSFRLSKHLQACAIKAFIARAIKRRKVL